MKKIVLLSLLSSAFLLSYDSFDDMLISNGVVDKDMVEDYFGVAGYTHEELLQLIEIDTQKRGGETK